jgi:hypothetical protein
MLIVGLHRRERVREGAHTLWVAFDSLKPRINHTDLQLARHIQEGRSPAYVARPDASDLVRCHGAAW